MDRPINYPGQVPLETDLLLTNQSHMVALAQLSQAIFGTAGMARGFATTQSVVPALNVLVAPGEIYAQTTLETTAVSSLPQDIAHNVVKQGIMLDAVTLAIAPPGTAGFSINYLIQVGYQDTDSGSTVLPYYNASNPSVAYSGPANSGAAQPTIRKGSAIVSAKAGTAATTGTQTTPAPDSGKVGLYVVTVANGASTVVNANISAYPGAPLVSTPVAQGRLLNVRLFTSTQTYLETPGTKNCIVRAVGAGGGGGGAPSTATGNTAGGLGGTGGSYVEGYYPVSSLSGQVMTIGAAGAGVANANGTAGGATSFGAVLTANGGGGGSVGQNLLPPWLLGEGGNGSVPTGGNIANVAGMTGQGSQSISIGALVSGRGGSSTFGQGGNARGTVRGAGASAVGYGSGGGGALETSAGPGGLAGGAGTGGCIVVFEMS